MFNDLLKMTFSHELLNLFGGLVLSSLRISSPGKNIPDVFLRFTKHTNFSALDFYRIISFIIF
jgi:hypothetical protein